MKLLVNALAACCLFAAIGCSSTETVSPGAMNECNSSCKEGSDCCKNKDASMGAVGENGCCKSKSSCSSEAAPGAVSDGSGCCKSKADMTSPGAVGDGNCASKCTKDAQVSPGAVGESNCSSKSSCASKCPMTGKSPE